MPVNTKECQHRELSFASVEEILAELDRCQAAHTAGTLQTSGNWSPGQIFEHCSKLMVAAYDGANFKGPLLLRLLMKIPPLKNKMLNGKMPKGIQIKGPPAAFFLPKDDTTFEQGLSALRQQLQRITSGDMMTKPSPIFGPMKHNQWATLNRKHCAMHFGFEEGLNGGD